MEIKNQKKFKKKINENLYSLKDDHVLRDSITAIHRLKQQ